MLKLMEKYVQSFTDHTMISNEFQQKQNILKGLSGAGTAQIISKCLSYMPQNEIYLEVGIYQAANLVLVASENKSKTCIGVDNFSQDFIENENYPDLTTEQVVQKRIKDFAVEENCKYYKADFREFLQKDLAALKGKVGIYFFDGPHEFQDQVDGIEMALPLLADEALIFVDDFASENVQKATILLLEKYKNNLSLIRLLKSDYNVREFFNQGQVVMKYSKNGVK